MTAASSSLVNYDDYSARDDVRPNAIYFDDDEVFKVSTACHGVIDD